LATGDFSHRAFDRLHRRYPHTEWAKTTPGSIWRRLGLRVVVW